MSVDLDALEQGDNFREIGLIIQMAARSKGITIKELSKRLGYSHMTIQRYISSNSSGKMPLELAVKAFNYLDIPKEPLLSNAYGLGSATFEDSDIPIKKGTKVFISYSHKDFEYMDRLMIHLKPLEEKKIIKVWVDTNIKAGDKWKKEIDKGLKESKAAILMVSADFLASPFIINNELPAILSKAKKEGTRVIPVILKPCRFNRDEVLNEFQALNRGQPLGLMPHVEREQIYDEVSERIENLFQTECELDHRLKTGGFLLRLKAGLNQPFG